MKNGTPMSKSDPSIVVVEGGLPAPIWRARLTASRLSYLTSGLDHKDRPTGMAHFLIETEDYRDYPDPEFDEGEFADQLLGLGRGYEEEDDDEEEFPGLGFDGEPVGLTLAPGGVLFVPCYFASPTEMASECEEWTPRAVGYTLFPPPPGDAAQGKPVIELARPMQTEDDAWKKALGFVERLGFRPEIAGDGPGLIFARTLACLVNEAALALGEGIASAADIDRAMKLGVNYPKGLLAWGDELGPNFILRVLRGLYDHYQDERYRPAPLLKRIVAAERGFLD